MYEKKSYNLPSISIVSCIYNFDLGIYKKHLDSVKSQKYPKKLIEHIVIDGGSENNAVSLAKKYGCRVFVRSDLKLFPQVRMCMAIQRAKNQLTLVLEPDNIMVGEDWLLQMVQPFAEHKEIFCTYSLHNSYTKDMSPMMKYSALFGSQDPTLYYLRKSEKMPLFSSKYNIGNVVEENKNYFVVNFSEENFPTLGDNGHMFTTKLLQSVATNPQYFTHTDASWELLKKGNNTVGVVKNAVIHVSLGGIFDVIHQRVSMKELWTNKKSKQRRYLVFNQKSKIDRINLMRYIFYSLTFVIPFLTSVKGYRKIKEPAWFLHPLICFFMVISYGISEVKWKIKCRALI